MLQQQAGAGDGAEAGQEAASQQQELLLVLRVYAAVIR
jgi:hypothetical protein